MRPLRPRSAPMATQAGVLLGTAAYMSPEQARGKLVDRRADIWAFGCVLYEMLTGKMAFGGGAVTDTLAAVLRVEPDWSQLPAATPTRVRVLLQRCLQKDPKQRLQATRRRAHLARRSSVGRARRDTRGRVANCADEMAPSPAVGRRRCFRRSACGARVGLRTSCGGSRTP